MTTEHPITPPPELVQQWTEEHQAIVDGSMYVDDYIATQAARWGADQELEACCAWANATGWEGAGDSLRAARRPKPPSLKKQALSLVPEPGGIPMKRTYSSDQLETIRRALEQLDD